MSRPYLVSTLSSDTKRVRESSLGTCLISTAKGRFGVVGRDRCSDSGKMSTLSDSRFQSGYTCRSGPFSMRPDVTRTGMGGGGPEVPVQRVLLVDAFTSYSSKGYVIPNCFRLLKSVRGRTQLLSGGPGGHSLLYSRTTDRQRTE